MLNERYERYMKNLGIDVFPSRLGVPQDKGKIEKRIRDLFSRIDLGAMICADMSDLHRRVSAELSKISER